MCTNREKGENEKTSVKGEPRKTVKTLTKLIAVFAIGCLLSLIALIML